MLRYPFVQMLSVMGTVRDVASPGSEVVHLSALAPMAAIVASQPGPCLLSSNGGFAPNVAFEGGTHPQSVAISHLLRIETFHHVIDARGHVPQSDPSKRRAALPTQFAAEPTVARSSRAVGSCPALLKARSLFRAYQLCSA